ncbi:hypothetical protein BS47DRAFT_1393302 [Hydnum rufescens UP504]|uniref:Anaphase-promoting complex subunit 4-like WD40 domain-containing protein n=1 Tax=Hydnum rufescens UP504 TaxID=1448309 RepID=A0A9P6DX28_9AGAM|nr:hypothetical protein BS47DRAFT_1393302 [Hydnum rufescens UP504]
MSDAVKRQRITADEVNCLVYAYLQDSGFTHSAWALKGEAHLDNSPNAQIPIPRGEIITLFRKALLYMEAEETWAMKEKGLEPNGTQKDTLVTLLGRHRRPGQQAPLDSQPIPQNRPAILPAPSSNEISSTAPMETVPSQAVPNPPKKSSPSPMPNGLVSSDKREGDSVSDESRPKKRPRTDEHPFDEASSSRTASTPVPEKPESKKSTPPNNTPKTVVKTTTPEAPTKVAPPSRTSVLVTPVDAEPEGVMILKGHTAEVFASAWNPTDPELLASGGKGGVVILWKIEKPDAPRSSGRPLWRILAHLNPSTHTSKEPRDMTSLSWNRAGTLLAVGHQDTCIRLWTPEGHLVTTLFGHQAPVFDVAWSENAASCCLDAEWLSPTRFATCGTDGRINIYDLGTPDPVKVLLAHQDEVNQVRLAPGGKLLASCSDDKSSIVWDLRWWTDENNQDLPLKPGPVAKVIMKGTHKRAVSMIQWSPNKINGMAYLLAAFSREDRAASLWDVRTGTCLKYFDEYHAGTKLSRDIFTHGFAPNGKFYSVGGVRYFIIYDVQTGNAMWTWPFKTSYVADVQWQREYGGRRVAIAKENAQVAIVDISKLGIPELQTMTGPE